MKVYRYPNRLVTAGGRKYELVTVRHGRAHVYERSQAGLRRVTNPKILSMVMDAIERADRLTRVTVPPKVAPVVVTHASLRWRVLRWWRSLVARVFRREAAVGENANRPPYKMTLCWLLMLVGCGGTESTGPRVDPLYQAVCVDSAVTHPTYRCEMFAPDTVEVVIIVTIPNPNP